MKIKTRIVALLLLVCTVIGLMPLSAISVFANGDGGAPKEDATEAIESGLASYKQGETQSYADDGYIGIPYEVTVYYDTAKGAVKPEYNGTVVVMYVVNTYAERTGTDTDVEIITSMLERGYVVVVLDYLNNTKAVSPELEWSVQTLRDKMKKGDYFENKTLFPNGTYYENHAVPAGHNIRVSDVFFEMDKHGEDGIFEKIVETWNYDFRSCRANTIIKWIDANGNRKATQNGWDGSSPVWYADAEGKTVDNANGQYIKINHTWAKKIEDCVKADGTPIDLNLYMHIIYPTNPENEVPVIVMSGSSEHLANSTAMLTRPHLVGFALNGYAAAVFDHEYVPMARDDHYGYFAGDQSSGVTGINNSFTVGRYTSANFNTAALRYLRYLSYTEDDIKFDDNAIGVYGNSKGGNQTFLGLKILRESKAITELGAGATKADLEAYIDQKITTSFADRYIVVMDPECQVTDKNGKAETYYDFDGSSRYQNGKTEDIVVGDYVIDGGELQPWLTYTDENGVLREIKSGANLIYSSCSGTPWNDWTDFSPSFTTSNFGDAQFSGGYDTHNYLPNLWRIYDVPSLYFEIPIGHSITYGEDIKYGIDTYTAFFKFCHYYLRNDPVAIAYADPIHGDSEVNTTDEIRIKFIGSVSATEVEKITVVDENGNVAVGTWSSECGNTEWHFAPKALNGGVKYTVTIPANIKGENGKEMGSAYSFSFYTKGESSVAFDMASPVTVTNAEGTHFSFTVPAEIEAPANRLILRFKVSNNAANIAKIYEAGSLSDTAGELIGSINLKGADYYEYDVTDYVMSKTAGEKVYFFVKAEKAAANNVTYTHDFDSKNNLSNISWSSETQLVTSVAGENVTALEQKITYGTATNSYGVIQGYSSWYPTALIVNKVINNGNAVTEADYGRTFTFKLRIYDTASRSIQLWFNDCTSKTDARVDYSYSRLSVKTVANEWMELTLPYTVYEMDYGVPSQVKQLLVKLWSDGSNQSPIYYDSLTVTEHVTDVEISEASLVSATVGGGEYKAPESTENHFEVNGKQYATWWEAISATSNLTVDGFTSTPEKGTIKLLSDYDFSSAVTSNGSGIASRATLVIDLNGYTVKLSDYSLFNFASENTNAVNYTVKNGTIIVEDSPIINYTRANASGNGKIYNINFDKVYVTVADGAATTNVISGDTSPAGASVTQNVKFIDCTINANRKALPKVTPCVIFPEGESNLTSTYEFVGGEIFVSSLVRLELTGYSRALTFKPDGNGNYTALKVCESVSVSKDMSILSDVGYSYFVLDNVADGYKTYKVTSAKYSTPYGVIPDDKSPEDYPFALFANGEFLGAYAIWSQSDAESALWAARKQMADISKSDVEVQLYLRRDYATDSKDHAYRNLAHFCGSVLIDLGTNTFTSESYAMFVAKAQTMGVDFNEQVRITVKNGTLVSGGTPIIQTSTGVANNRTAEYKQAQKYYIDFTDVDFEIPADGSQIITTSSANHENGAVFNTSFTDCNFNFAAGFSGVAFSGIHSGDANNVNILNVKISGGNISAADISKVTFFDGGAGDSLIYGANEGGEYTTLTMPTSVELPTFGGKNDKGVYVEFGDGVVSGTNTVYTLSESNNATKYGVIPKAYEDTEKYPFAVFQNGQFVAAFSVLIDNTDSDGVTSAFEQVRALTQGVASSSAQILMRRDYTNSLYGFNNISQIDGELIIDLDNHTLTHTDAASMFSVTAKASWKSGVGNSCPDTNIKLINGSFITKGPLVRFSTVVPSYNTDGSIKSDSYGSTTGFEHVNFFFEDLDITFTNTWCYGLIAYCYQNANSHPTKAAYFNVNITDCNIDITSITQGTTMLALGKDYNGTNLNNLSVQINGGKIITNKTTTLTLGEYDSIVGDNGDSIVFGKGSDGKYLEIETDNWKDPGFEVPTVEDGTSYWGRYSATTVSGVTTYVHSIGEKTEYGVIPYNYDPEEYPFAVFKGGYLIGAYSAWQKSNSDSALWRARNQMASLSSTDVVVQILLRSDYATTNGSTDTPYDEWYANFAHFCGTLIVDLGGNTFTADGRPMFIAKAQTMGTDFNEKVRVTVKNGTLVSKGNNIVYTVTEVATSRMDYYTKAQVMSFDFNNIDFVVPANGRQIITTGASNHANGAIFNINFNDCNFDLTKCGGTVIFNGSSGNDANNVNILNIKINGGKILANTFNGTSFFTPSAGDTLILGRSGGKYITLTQGKGVATPTLVFDTEENYKAIFERVDGSDTEYILVPNEMKIIGAYLNITENINVCYAVRLPDGYESPYMVFEFNGKSYTVINYVTRADGSLVFKFVGVTPQMIGDNIKATFYATKDGKEESVEEATYSVKTYCVNMLAKTTDTKLITLLSDLLIYGAASQTFTEDTDALVTNGVEGLTSSTFTEVTKTDMALVGTPSTSVSWKSVALRYENAMAMKFTFKADANLVLKITINGRTTSYNVNDLVANEDTGYYIVYFRGILATEYGDVVTASFYDGYTQVGQSATYSVNSYVYSKQGDAEANLAALVKATYNYGKSAELYATRYALNDVAGVFESIVSSNTGTQIKLLGDSITHGVSGTGFAQNGETIIWDYKRNPDGYCWANLFRDYMAENYNCTVVNNACTGRDIEFIINNFNTLVDAEDDLIICAIGTNNRQQYHTENGGVKYTEEEFYADFYNKILTLNDMFKAANKTVIFIANIPASEANEQDGSDYWRVLHMDDIRDAYTEASGECGFPMINLYDMFNAYCEKNAITLDSLLKDGVHPNDTGYKVMFDLITEALGA